MKLTAPAHELHMYHWAPTARRKAIKRKGLMPGSLSVGREWRPPFVCFSEEPWLAWHLSGRIHPEITEWDLWMVRACDLDGYEVITDTYPDTGRSFIKEFRVYHRIFKRDVYYIASRSS